MALDKEKGLAFRPPSPDSREAEGAEALLLDQRQVLNVLKSMGEGLMVLSPDAEILFANRAAENLLGYGPGGLAGLPAGKVVDDDNLTFFSALRDMIRKGQVRDVRLDCVSRDSKKIPVSLNGAVLRADGNGRVLGMALVARDVRDILGLVRELEEAKTGLEEKVMERTRELEGAYAELKETQAQLLQNEKMASIGQLAAGMAHEINNPVSFLLGNLGVLDSYVKDLTVLVQRYEAACGAHCAPGGAPGKEMMELDEARKALDPGYIVKECVSVIRESREGAERVRKIVEDLRNFSHIDSSDFTHADINEGIESTVNIAFNEVRHRAKVLREYGQLPKVWCNAGEINQVFMNLLINALQAMEGAGEIRVRTRHDAGRVHIEVSDNGCGIAPENLKRIFDPFFTTKPVGVGTGLGLTIAYKIVKRHGGGIRVESEKGKGSVFTVDLPVEPPGKGRDQGNAP